MTDLHQEIYVAMPVSQKPDKDDIYFGYNEGKTAIHSNDTYRFVRGHWQEFDYESGQWDAATPGAITHYLQKKTLLDVLGSLKVPRFVKVSERMPDKPGRYVVKRLGECMMCDAVLRKNIQMVFVYPNGMTWPGFKDFEWLDEGNLSDLLYKVAEDAYDKGFADAMENDSPDKAQYLEQFKTSK